MFIPPPRPPPLVRRLPVQPRRCLTSRLVNDRPALERTPSVASGIKKRHRDQGVSSPCLIYGTYREDTRRSPSEGRYESIGFRDLVSDRCSKKNYVIKHRFLSSHIFLWYRFKTDYSLQIFTIETKTKWKYLSPLPNIATNTLYFTCFISCAPPIKIRGIYSRLITETNGYKNPSS